MGNEASNLSGLEVYEKACDCTDFWSHYQASVKDSCRYFSVNGNGLISVFKGEIGSLGPLWTVSTPLEKFCNNILKYRHPFIVRYISSWLQRSTFHLATEYVQPLAHKLTSQTPLQKCIGLNNILQALVFLHEHGQVSHNNVCISSIYICGDDQWKLGGLQYLCSFSELTSTYLKQARLHRYDKAIDPNEESSEYTATIDQYAFAVLVDEVLNGCKDDDIPHLKDFKTYCRECLQNSESTKRPKLSAVLQHNFFNHEFILLHKFLSFLALKTEDEKGEFFSNILDHLKCYDEETVAKQFGGLLLSRLVLLDHTARVNVIPYILKPRNDRQKNCEQNGFFSLSIFKDHLKPRLLQLFSVRDSQIRMILLTHFSKYVNVFSHEELSQQILPELLLGIKDIDDNLVSSTLQCLSELVPILGAETVIGGKRSRIFTDGRPNSNSVVKKEGNHVNYNGCNNLNEFSCSENVYKNVINQTIYDAALSLNERPSPVGGESIDVENISILENSKKTGEAENWDEWDNDSRETTSEVFNEFKMNENFIDIPLTNNEKAIDTCSYQYEKSKTHLLQRAAIEAKKNIIDISELDIKNTKEQMKKNVDDVDFFADMTPVIEKQNIIVLSDNNISSKFNFVPSIENDDNEGWGETWND
ncbi:unnamed protein product [Leptidea sinapis]|uniref:Protein kinase domain-containing protein n=1 Tax=Leptidea sinapis TaxID=189913 RepID=A0A5E4Q118_9NEOP|nr:unnamed protein product [Leptidea sinapis]